MIYTVGHSTHTAADFLQILRAHGVMQIADVRTIPRSRRHPHFNAEALRDFLAEAGVGYRHFPGLGGLRKPRRDSVNTGWRHPSFRGYADHMDSTVFQEALEALLLFSQASLEFPQSARTAVMCAERVWWECHRRLLSDALVVRGVPVRHILSAATANPHQLSDFARPSGSRVTYPGLL